MVYSTYPRGYFADAALNKSGSWAAVGVDFGKVTEASFTSRDFRFIKIDSVVSNDLNCNYGTLDYQLSTTDFKRSNFLWTTDSAISILSRHADVSVDKIFTESRYSCPDFLDSCSFMRISGPTS